MNLREHLPWTKAARMRRRARNAVDFTRFVDAFPDTGDWERDLIGDKEPNVTGLLANMPEGQIPRLPPADEMLAQIAEIATGMDPPAARRMEVGNLSRFRLAVGSAPMSPLDMQVMLFGIPIVETDKLGPDGWRLLGDDGQVIKQGTL